MSVFWIPSLPLYSSVQATDKAVTVPLFLYRTHEDEVKAPIHQGKFGRNGRSGWLTVFGIQPGVTPPAHYLLHSQLRVFLPESGHPVLDKLSAVAKRAKELSTGAWDGNCVR
jgi:hypothetical protein